MAVAVAATVAVAVAVAVAVGVINQVAQRMFTISDFNTTIHKSDF
jgi:hypothetical protein